MKKLLPILLACMSVCAFEKSLSDAFAKGANTVKDVVVGQKPLAWRWRNIGWQSPNFLASLQFPSNFQWGAADVCRRSIAEKSSEIQLMKEAGFTMHSFVIDWSEIEPVEGEFHEAALSGYIQFVRDLKNAGIEPVISLGHTAWPQWFIEKGGFEEACNSDYFMSYAAKVFEALHNEVTHWIPLHGPVGYAFEAYYRGHLAPYKKSLKITGAVAAHMLEAHAACYKLFKTIDASCQIGYAHVVHPLDPAHRWNPVERAAAATFDHLLNRSPLDYLSKGIFNWSVAGKKLVYRERPSIKGCYDFVGVIYQTRSVISMGITGMKTVEDLVYAEGLYRAIALCGELSVPIMVVENGANDPYDRIAAEYIHKHLYAVCRALKDGYDIRAYCYRSLLDIYSSENKARVAHGLYRGCQEEGEWSLKQSSIGFINLLQRNAYNA